MKTILLFLWLAVPAMAQEPIGMMLQFDGVVRLQRGGDNRSPQIAEFVYAGDRLTTAAGGAVFVFCPSQEMIALSADTSVLLDAELKVISGTVNERSPAPCMLPKMAIGDEDLSVVTDLAARGIPAVMLYLGGPISQSRPQFSWGLVVGATQYAVSVRNSDDDVIWETRTDVGVTVYPSSKPALIDGSSYRWQVRALVGDTLVAEQSATFRIKTGRPTGPQYNDLPRLLLRAAELENSGYFAEAAALYRQVRAMTNDERITHHLVLLYWNASLIAAANEEKKRLGQDY